MHQFVLPKLVKVTSRRNFVWKFCYTTGNCSLKYWGKHKRKMAIRGIELTVKQTATTEIPHCVNSGITSLYRPTGDKWITIIHLWWLFAYGHHLPVTIYLHVAPSPGRHITMDQIGKFVVPHRKLQNLCRFRKEWPKERLQMQLLTEPAFFVNVNYF